MTDRRGGFTIAEVLVAIVLLSIGLLALASTSGLVTRMVARGEASGAGATFAARRMEILRTSACTSPVAGSDSLYNGSVLMATGSWSFSQATAGDSIQRIFLTVTRTHRGASKVDSLESEVTCRT